MIELDQRPARLDLGLLDDLGEVIDGADGNVVREQQRLPLFVGALEKCLLQTRDQSFAVAGAVGNGAIERIVRQLRAADDRTQYLPQLLTGDRQREIAGPGVKGLVRDHRRVRRAHRPGNFAVRKIVAERRAKQRELPFKHRDID